MDDIIFFFRKKPPKFSDYNFLNVNIFWFVYSALSVNRKSLGCRQKIFKDLVWHLFWHFVSILLINYPIDRLLDSENDVSCRASIKFRCSQSLFILLPPVCVCWSRRCSEVYTCPKTTACMSWPQTSPLLPAPAKTGIQPCVQHTLTLLSVCNLTINPIFYFPSW